MMTLPILLSVGGFIFTIGVVVQYFRTIPRMDVPTNIGWLTLRLVIGVSLCAAVIALDIVTDSNIGPLAYIPAVMGMAFGMLIIWVLSLRKTPLGNIKVKIGDTILPFTAQAVDGNHFDSSEFAGKRVLLKFFRGGWCPYCTAELVAFDNMNSDLEKYGVILYALSKDTPAEASLHKSRDGLNIELLSDPSLNVIRIYGVEHHKALGMAANPKRNYGGIPLSMSPVKFEAMAIPTTILIDENGTIRWIDQADDYRIRSSTERVMRAVMETVFRDQNGTGELKPNRRENRKSKF